MKRASIALGVVALVAVAALTGFRAHHGHDPARMNAFVTQRLDALLTDIHATPEQRQQITAMKDKLLADAQQLHATRAADHQELLAQWRSDQPDAAKIHALIDARIDAMRALAHEAADDALKVHATLTPEQRAQVTAKLEAHAAKDGPPAGTK